MTNRRNGGTLNSKAENLPSGPYKDSVASGVWTLDQAKKFVALDIWPTGGRELIIGQQAYISAGTFTWVAPSGVTSVSVVCVGGGGNPGTHSPDGGYTNYANGGGGGGLAYTNGIAVNVGSSYTVVVGASGAGHFSSFNTSSCKAGGGSQGSTSSVAGGAGGTVINGDGGGSGGAGANGEATNSGGGGGGAGGYSGNGGVGGMRNQNGGNGLGGGGGGGGGYGGSYPYGTGGGGGVGILGEGSSGAGGQRSSQGFGGSGGTGGITSQTSGVNAMKGGIYGGGGDASSAGAVRIIWPGSGTPVNRTFPSTRTGDL